MVRGLLMMFNFQQINGGQVQKDAKSYQLLLPNVPAKYANAQIDDYAGLPRNAYLHRPKTHLTLEAKFSHNNLVGTAGFGFWNAPYGDPTTRTPALPNALWFFYAGKPNHLPFLHGQTGWFAATIAVKSWHALLAPFALLNWLPMVEPRLWPRLTRALGIRFVRISAEMTQWHRYEILWGIQQTSFLVDGCVVLSADTSPSLPLGFVAWIDNQYLVATPKGRLSAGSSHVNACQRLHLRNLNLQFTGSKNKLPLHQ